MIGPHHSIMRCLISTGHGAAAWIAICSDDTSYFARTASGSFSMRTNIVGTNCACVTPYLSIAARQPSGSKFSSTMFVPPKRFTAMQNCNGAAWYSGAGDR